MPNVNTIVVRRRVVALENERYTYRAAWSEQDAEYVGLCTDFRSLSWLASTPEAALKGIRRVVADVVADMEANEESVPEPTATKGRRACPPEVTFLGSIGGAAIAREIKG